MLNLSNIVKESSSIPFIKKVEFYFSPEFYFSENIKDFQEEDFSELPLYKKIIFNNKIYIIFKDIGLDRLKDNWFMLHDSSGKELAYWGEKDDLVYPTLASFDNVKLEQGLKEKDWVYEILAGYSISDNLLNIIKVDKYSFLKKSQKDLAFDKIKNSGFKPIIQPAF